MSDSIEYTSYMQLTTCRIDDDYDGALGIKRIFQGVGGTGSVPVNRIKVVPSRWALSAQVSLFVHYTKT